MSDIVADLLRIHELLSSKPFPQAIWFIDRENDYHRLLHTIPEYEPNPYQFSPTLGGMPVHCWNAQEIRRWIEKLLRDPAGTIEKARQVFPFCQPGIWVQMSDGKHEHIELTN